MKEIWFSTKIIL